MFREILKSLGMIEIDGLCIHRITNQEISKLVEYTGDDLWNIIAKVNDCGEWIEILEKKEKQKKFLAVNSQVQYHLRDMEEILPRKLEFLNKFRNFFNLRKEFNTLMNILEKRNERCLKSQLRKVDEELKHSLEEFKEVKSKDDEENHNNHITNMKIDKISSLKNFIEKNHDEMKFIVYKMKFIKEKSTSVNLNLEQIVEQVTTFNIENQQLLSMIQEKTEFIEFYKIKAEMQALQVKVSLLSTENPQEKLESMKVLLKKREEFMNDIKIKIQPIQIEIQKLTEKLNLINFDIHQEKVEISNQILEMNSEILKHEKQKIEFDFEIISAVKENNLDLDYINTLQKIEILVQSDENIAQDYLGPIFTNLKLNLVDSKLFPKLIETSKIIIFSRGATARKFIKRLKTLKIQHSSFTILGQDEFVPKRIQGNSENLESADFLIKENVRFKEVLRTFLREFVFLNEDEVCNTKSLTSMIQTSSGCVTKSQGFLEFHSNFLETLESLMKVYEIIKKSVTNLKSLEQSREIRDNLENILKEKSKLSSTVNVATIYQDVAMLLIHLQHRRNYQEYLTKTQVSFPIIHETLNEVVNISNMDLEALKTELKIKAEIVNEIELTMWKKYENEIDFTITKMEKSLKNLQFLKSIETKFQYNWSELHENSLQKHESFLEQLANDLTIQNTELNQLKHIPILNIDSITNQIEILYEICKKKSDHSTLKSALSKIEGILHNFVNQSHLIIEKTQQEFQSKPTLEIVQKLIQLQKKITEIDNKALMTEDAYIHLVETIEKIRDYSKEQFTYKRNKIAARSYPFLNQSLVKMLKDTVSNYQISFRAIMSKFIERSALFFYTQGAFDEIKHDDFSWNCFDMTRLKAMDFVIEWKSNELKNQINTESLRKVKSLLLILHVINYLSVFKFLIITETFFDNMNEDLKKCIHDYFKVVSPFVQIIVIRNTQTVEVAENSEDEISEILENDEESMDFEE